MKFRYDKTTGRVVEKPEREPPKPFELLPVSPELQVQIEAMEAFRSALAKNFL